MISTSVRKKIRNKKFVGVKEFHKQLPRILKSLPKDKMKEVKKDDVNEQHETLDNRVNGSRLEDKIDIPSRPITGVQTTSSGVNYEHNKGKMSDSHYQGNGYGLANPYYLIEKEELDANKVSHFEEEKVKFVPFFSAEERDRARDRARRLFPGATEEDILRYESKLLRRKK